MLRLASVQVCSPIFKMKYEPQLNAWVRHRDTNAVLRSQAKRFRHPRMNIDIEYAPVSIICVATTSLSLSKINGPLGNRGLD
jgi:hypothetical protein